MIGVAPPRDRIRVTLRYDLPDPPAADLVAEIAAHALGVLSAQRLTAAVAVGYGPEALVTPVARELREAAWQAGIDVREFLRVADGRYWSYVCGNEKCCPAEGVPFDATAADPAEAEALTAVGDRVLATRAAVVARVAPSAASPPSRCARPPAGPSSTSPSCWPRSAGPAASAPPGR